jgi:hypothetical protein
MKNKSTIARLLAEEDIHIVNKAMDTAYFNIKKRELGLPIWKDEISKDEEELMVCHEIGHALWTSMDMMENAKERNINHSFMNILEDARIEKFVKRKYPGSVNLFKKGYTSLAARNFFGLANENVNDQNLIDRINLFFKMMPDVEFSDVEKVFVDRAEKLETENEVLDLAEDLYKFMEENPDDETQDNNDAKTDGHSSSDNSDKGNEENGDDADDNGDDADDNGGDKKSNDSSNTSDKSEVDGKGQSSDDTDGGDDDATASDSNAGIDSPVDDNKGSTSKGKVPESKTDTAFNNSLKSLADNNAIEKLYARIPKLKSEEYIVDYKNILSELEDYYPAHQPWVNYSLNEVKEFKNDSKKTVAYMVKEFEMKKSADQYARAATSKTGSLDMGLIHTYKYNDDLFKKVTTLPGATNHGMVMVIDWSGSMASNMKGTIEQLLQLVMFCRRTKIPFEVFAFTSVYGYGCSKNEISKANYGELTINNNTRLLNFFSSKMTSVEEEKMMHYVWMMAKRFSQVYEDWTVTGMPTYVPSGFNLGQTPLDDTIVIMMDFLEKYKKSTGVQKLNAIFLTDGASSRSLGVKDCVGDADIINRFGRHNLLIDPINNKRYEISFGNSTEVLLTALKNKIDNLNIVGFFLAGSGRSGNIKRNTWYYILGEGDMDSDQAMAKMRKDKVVMLESKGYDKYFILPGGGALSIENDGLSDELVGASKAKLKSAFAKSNKGRIQSRVLLNKFVEMVA